MLLQFSKRLAFGVSKQGKSNQSPRAMSLPTSPHLAESISSSCFISSVICTQRGRGSGGPSRKMVRQPFSHTCNFRKVDVLAIWRKKHMFLPFRKASAVCLQNCSVTKYHLEARPTVGTNFVWTGQIAALIWQATACNAQFAKVSFRNKSDISMKHSFQP